MKPGIKVPSPSVPLGPPEAPGCYIERWERQWTGGTSRLFFMPPVSQTWCPRSWLPRNITGQRKKKIPNRSRLFIAKEKTCKQQLLYSFHQGPRHAKSRQRRSSTPRGPDEASQQPCPRSDREGVSQAQWCPRLIVPNTEKKSNTNHIHCSRKQRRREHFCARLLQSTARWSNQRSLPEHRCKTR